MPRTGYRVILALAATMSSIITTRAEAGSACAWVEGHEKIGIACEGSQEMWYAALSCEGAPLHLYLIGEECGAAKCSVGVVIDGGKIPLGLGDYSDDGEGGIILSLSGKRAVLERLRDASALAFTVGHKPKQEVPTAGLRHAVGTLLGWCPQ